MRRRLLQAVVCAGLFCVCAGYVGAQEPTQEENNAPENTLGPWKIANTLLFAAFLGFVLYRTAPKFFNARTADIQKAIKDATGLKLEADFRYSEIDRKMATLSDEVKRMRDESAREMEREHQRVQRETESEIARLHQNIANEIDAFRKDGTRQVRKRIALAAIERAEQQLRERISGTEPEDLVQGFIHAVEKGRK